MKHRIVGAAILISFGALFLPWLLGNPKSAESNEPIDISVFNTTQQPADSKQVNDREVEDQIQVYVSKITPLTKPLDTTKGQSKLEKKTGKNAAVVKQNDFAKPDSASANSKTVNKSGADKKQTNKDIERGYIVSVGVYSKTANVKAIMTDLKNKGFAVSSSKTETSKGPGTRVWLGPFEKRVDAAKARTDSNLKQLTGEPGLIMAYP